MTVEITGLESGVEVSKPHFLPLRCYTDRGEEAMASSSRSSKVAAKQRPPKRLLFDRRYGWVFDEWKDPSEEALAGGRGMFCILPLGKALIKIASQSINLMASSAVKIIERPDQFSPQVLQANVNDQFQKFMSSFQGPNLNFFTFKGNSPILSTSCLQHLPSESSDPQNVKVNC